ncbi:hypothetical protein QZH41_018608, partial [Actinostola sp. cb2023]
MLPQGSHKIFRQQETSASKLFVTHAPHYVSFLQNAGPIPSNEIASINSLALGLSAPKELTWAGLLAGNMFKRPKARILFAVDGITQGNSIFMPRNCDNLKLNAGTSFPIDEVFILRIPIEIMHGFVKTLKDGIVLLSFQTHDAPDLEGILSQSNALHENLPSRVSKTFGGKSLSLSISGDGKLAASGSSAGENSHSLFYDQKNEKFQATNNVLAFLDLQLSKKQVHKFIHLEEDQILIKILPKSGAVDLTRFSQNYRKLLFLMVRRVFYLTLFLHVISSNHRSMFLGIKVSSDGKVVTVAVPGQGNAVFDLNKKEDFLLFAEAQIVSDVLEKLKRNPALVNDNVPDILTFSFSSVKALRDRYGENSLQAKGAVVFLSSIIPKLTKGFFDLYNGNALVEVLAMEWQGNLKDKFPAEVGHIFHHLEPHLASDSVESFSQQLPSVTLRGDVDDTVMESLCDSLHNKLLNMQSKLKVNCLGSSVLHRSRRALGESASPAP